MNGISLFFAIFQVVMKLIPEFLAMKARADERKEKLEIDEKALYLAAKSLMERSLTNAKKESKEAKKIDEVMDRELREHENNARK